MESNNIMKLKNLFAEVLGLEVSEISDSLAYRDRGWDSVAHMQIVATIEREFDVMLEPDDVLNMKNVKAAREIIEKHGILFTP